MPHKLTNEIDSLLVHVLRCPEVFALAYQYLKPDALGGEYFFSQRLIWSAARSLYRKYEIMPQHHTISVEVHTLLDEGGLGDADLTARAIDDALGLVEAMFAFPEDKLMADFAIGHLQRVIDRAEIKPMAERIKMSETSDDLMKNVQDMAEAFTATRLDVPTETEIIDLSSLEGLRENRIPTGAEYIDHLLNGGIVEGRVYGLLGGSGGGKTAISIHLSCELALRSLHVNYFTYEQSLTSDDPDIPRRIYSCAGRIKRTTLADVDPKDWSESDREKALEIEKTVKPFLHTYDMSGAVKKAGNGGIFELERTLRQDQLKGRRATLNVIDWCLPMLKRYMASKKIKADQYRDEITTMVDMTKKYAARYGGCWLIVNQLAPAELGSPGKAPKWSDSAEAKNFAWLMDSCFTIGIPSEDGFMQFVVSKNRGYKPGVTTIEFDPDYARLLHHSGLKYNSRNKGFNPEGSSSDKFPDTEKGKSKGEELSGS